MNSHPQHSAFQFTTQYIVLFIWRRSQHMESYSTDDKIICEW